MKDPKRPDAARALTGAMLLFFLTGMGPRLAAAGIAETDIAANSKLELLEKAVSGSYESYSISVVTREGATTLSANKDGTQSMLQVPLEETLALWRTLLDAGLESLGDASPESPAPDGSEFIVSFRAGEASGGFTASGVDSLSDTRYRQIVREILRFADTRVAGGHRGN